MGRQFCVACVWHLCVLHVPKDVQDKVVDRISTKRCNSIDIMSVHSNMKPLLKNFVIRITCFINLLLLFSDYRGRMHFYIKLLKTKLHFWVVFFVVVFDFSEVHGTENPLNKRQAPDAWCRQGSARQRDLLDRMMKQRVDPNTPREPEVRTELFKNKFLHSLLCKVAY